MTTAEVLKLVEAVGPIPKNPIAQRAGKSHCPCGAGVLLVCDRTIKFHPAYYVCPSCKRTVQIGRPSEKGAAR